jgi:hypothetical protein
VRFDDGFGGSHVNSSKSPLAMVHACGGARRLDPASRRFMAAESGGAGR